MIEINRPVAPMFLYRYRGLGPEDDDSKLHNEVDAIKNGYLFLSSYDSMNDPMEGGFRPSPRFKYSEDYNESVRDINNSKLDIGLCCLSEGKDIGLMWAHYADNYSGFCVSYRVRNLLRFLPNNTEIARLGYGDEMPPVNDKARSDLRRVAINILSHKKSYWSYEKEWRVFGSKGKLFFVNQCVARVYLGPRILKNKRKYIMDNLRGEGIEVWQMSVVGYRHDFKLIRQGGVV